jgi:hypothetical protein
MPRRLTGVPEARACLQAHEIDICNQQSQNFLMFHPASITTFGRLAKKTRRLCGILLRNPNNASQLRRWTRVFHIHGPELLDGKSTFHHRYGSPLEMEL